MENEIELSDAKIKEDPPVKLDDEEKKIWDNGLTKSAEEITEYTIRIQEDSLKNEIHDTLLIAIKKYRDDDQLALQTRKCSPLNGQSLKSAPPLPHFLVT